MFCLQVFFILMEYKRVFYHEHQSDSPQNTVYPLVERQQKRRKAAQQSQRHCYKTIQVGRGMKTAAKRLIDIEQRDDYQCFNSLPQHIAYQHQPDCAQKRV